jgi:hypothetical protein
MHVSVEKDEMSDYETGSELTKSARSRHLVEEVMARILAKQRPNTKKLALGHTDQENGGTNDRWH